MIHSRNSSYPIDFTTGESTKYICVYFNGGEYDYEAKKDRISLQIDRYTEQVRPHIPIDYLPENIPLNYVLDEEMPVSLIPKKQMSPLYDAQILIFGDSITTTCNITVNDQKQTTQYSFGDPSNSYTDTDGNHVTFSMWPKILRDSEACREIRNYAYSGASFKSQDRQVGNERQNGHYQIDLAINDVDNPNGAFTEKQNIRVDFRWEKERLAVNQMNIKKSVTQNG